MVALIELNMVVSWKGEKASGMYSNLYDVMQAPEFVFCTLSMVLQRFWFKPVSCSIACNC